MPDQISVSEFVAETHEDYKAPTASSFTTRTAQCRNTVAAIEEVSGSLGERGGRLGPRGPRGALGTRRRPRLLCLDAQCPPPAPTPGKSFWSPRAGRSRAGSARHRSPLFPERWLWGEALWPPWAFLGETLLSALISLAGFQVLGLIPGRGQLRPQSPWRLRAGDPCARCSPGWWVPPARTSPTCSRSGPAGAAVLPEPAAEQVQGTPKLLRQGCHPSPGGLAAPTACRRAALPPGWWRAGALRSERPLVAAPGLPVWCLWALWPSPLPLTWKRPDFSKGFQGAESLY